MKNQKSYIDIDVGAAIATFTVFALIIGILIGWGGVEAVRWVSDHVFISIR